MNSFRTHKGETVSGERLQAAIAKVSQDWETLAHEIRIEDSYASHVTEEEKDAFLQRGLERARAMRRPGFRFTLSDLQRINLELTGETIALLP